MHTPLQFLLKRCKVADQDARRLPSAVLLGFSAAVQAFAGGCHPESPQRSPTSQPVPRRIISIAPDATEMIASLGQTRRLIAVCAFCVWPPEIKALPRIGGLYDASA